MAIPAVMIIALTVVITQVVTEPLPNALLYFIIVIYVVLILLISKGFTSHDIYYDTANLLLKHYRGVDRIPFQDVKRIKLTSGKIRILGMTFNQYRIDYNAKGEMREITLWSLIGGKSIDEFGEVVRQVNKGVKVEHWY
ncbi:hypothetical protein WBG78_19140 [Chryseolinea sp. T2]|uniref:hypothetical protein n=1 Tax=Chryseolinea sp. T2 TaxID=3129255 RepID=UPI003078410E